MQVDATAYRAVMARLATGVTVLTTNIDGRPEVMTANSVTSVSLDPVLLLAGVSRQCRWSAAVQVCGSFVVNVLSEQQSALSAWCAGAARHDQPLDLDEHPTRVTPTGNLVFEQSLASFDCRLYDVVRAGDHDLMIGEVQDMWVGDQAAPLLFFGGSYATLGRRVAARPMPVAACS